MTFDRSKFSGGRRAIQSEQDAIAKKFERKPSTGTHSMWYYPKDGKNTWRVAPPHDANNPAFENYRTCSLEVMCPIYKDNEDTGKTELRKRKIVSALIHSKELSKLGTDGDPVELYVKMIKDHAFKAISDKKERQKYLAPINGYRLAPGTPWIWGIEPKTAKLAYAWINGENEPGYLEIQKNWYDDMQRLITEMEEDGQPIMIDPFSDPTEGYPLTITRGKDDNGKTTFLVGKDLPSQLKKESWDQFFLRTQVTDAQLEELIKKTPLADSFRDGYSMREFDIAMEGLKRFDDKYDFGFFDMDEYQEKVAIIKGILEGKEASEPKEDTSDAQDEKKAVDTPETSKVDTPEVKPTVVKKKIVPKKKPVKKQVTDEAMIKEISSMISEVYGEEYLPQIPKGSELKTWYDAVVKDGFDAELPLEAAEDFVQPVEEAIVETPEEETPVVEVPKEVEKPVATKKTPSVEGQTAADKIREKLANRKKAK